MNNRTEEEHPAFGLISISNISGHITVFGSELDHQYAVRLRIHRAVRARDLHTSWVYPKGILIEVDMSQAQWAQFICSSGTSGVPCTIKYLGDEGLIPEVPKDVAAATHAHQEVKQKAQQYTARLSALVQKAKTMEEAATVSKKERREFTKELSYAVTDITSNLPFILTMLHEAMDDVVTDAKHEFEAFVNMSLQERGLTTTQYEMPQLVEETHGEG